MDSGLSAYRLYVLALFSTQIATDTIVAFALTSSTSPSQRSCWRSSSPACTSAAGRASPRQTKKAGDFPARKPGEPSVTTVTRRIELHLLQPPGISLP